MGLFRTWELLKKAGHQGTIGLFDRLPYENENWQQQNQQTKLSRKANIVTLSQQLLQSSVDKSDVCPISRRTSP